MTEPKGPHDCVTVSCPQPAMVRVYWPGRGPVLMCIDCAERAVTVGDALGCFIPVEPVFVPPRGES